ncbi:FG-GAP repeat protein [Actinophytocola oryzae]|uniref:FG-GAP repeat protein n=1 Tax=Actinophytocola oryzae TaxID=502181 RepID=UPI0014150832|nr:FG-GAP repeat protein [Actinophytocola oryzae]
MAATIAVALLVAGLGRPAAATPPPTPTVTADTDTDGDAIPDLVETGGIRRPDGSVSMDLAALGASPCRKTVVIEVDYMADGDHSHAPDLFGGPPGVPDKVLGVVDTRFEDDPHNQLAVGDLDADGRAEVVIADASEGGRIHVYDPFTHLASPALGVTDTRFENNANNQLAVGNVDGQGGDEIVIADASEGGRIGVFDATTHLPSPSLGVTDTRFENSRENQLAVGDLDGDGKDEILVADASEGGRIHVYDAVTHLPSPTLGVTDTRFEDDRHNQLAVGNVDGQGGDEIVIADASEGGRIGVFDATTHLPSPTLGVDDSTFENDSHNQVAVGDVNGDGRDEILVANDSGGRIDALDAVTRGPVKGLGVSDTRFNNDAHNQIAVGDLDDTVDGRAELLHADASEGGQIQVFDAAAPLGPVNQAIAMFDNAPVAAVADCPYPGADSRPGVDMIVDVSGAVPEQAVLDMPSGFDAIKAVNFDPARDPYVHYNIWGHQYSVGGVVTGSSGLSLFSDGQDFLVSLGGFGGGNGTSREQAGTFVHELGHTLGLKHGGGDDINHKPNYLSAMNYNFQLSGMADVTTGESLVAYSDAELPQLDQKLLSEPAGIGSDLPVYTTYRNTAGGERIARADGPIDWNGDNDAVDVDVLAQANKAACVGPGANGTSDTEPKNLDNRYKNSIRSGDDFVCDTPALGDDEQEYAVTTDQRLLDGYDDWTNLEFTADPVPAMPTEITTGEADELAQAHDQALAPDVTVALAPARPGYTAPVLGVATDARHVYATHYYESVAEPHTSDQPGSLVVLDRKTMRVTGRIPVGYRPHSVAVDDVTGRIYVLGAQRPGEPNKVDLTVIDRRTQSVVATIALPTGQTATDVVVNERTGRVYVSNNAFGRIHVVDGRTNTELAPIMTGKGPLGMAVDPDTDTLYVAMSYVSSDPKVAGLTAITDDGVTQVVHPMVSLGAPSVQPRDVTIDRLNDRIYVAAIGGGATRPGVSVLRLSTREVLGHVDTAGPARAVAVDPFAHQAFVAAQGRIDVVGQHSLTSIRTIPTASAFSVAVADGPGRHLFTGDLLSGALTRLAYSSGTRK